MDRYVRYFLRAALAATFPWIAVGSLLYSPASQSDQSTTLAALLDQSLDGPQRSAANRARDAARHPKQTLLFFGLRPNQSVVEIAPGGGWYTEVLAPALRESGKLYAMDLPGVDGAETQRMRDAFQKKLANNPAVFDRVSLDTPPAASADMVVTFRNIHNWIKAGQLDANLKAFYAMLKPGGVLGVEEHRAPEGTPLERIIATGYVPESYVITHARAAGFRLTGHTDINANKLDDHDHPDGVWSLPPTLRGGDKDRDLYLTIGESDRMTLRFVKPSR